MNTPIQTRTWSRILGLAVALLALADRARALAADAVWIPPWFDSNAVLLAPMQYRKPSQRTYPFISGKLQGRIDLTVQFFPGPDVKQDTDDLRFLDKPSNGWSDWSLDLASLNQREWEAIQTESGFGARIFKKSEKTPLLTLTNLVFGQVHAVHVDPQRDSHELPEVSARARAQVRILILTNGAADRPQGRWMPLAEAVDRRIPELCGLPRALAETLIQTDPRPLGIVILPDAAAAPPGSVDLPIRSPYWQAARQPDSPISAENRKNRRHQRELLERIRKKDEGIVVAETPVPATWSRILDGPRTKLPFPVTAEVW
jgi:hypothetical protein